MNFLYAVIVQMPLELEEDWTDWMRARHIPDVMATGMFVRSRLLRDTAVAGRYTVLYEAASLEDYVRYKHEFAPALQAAHRERYDTKVTATRMELFVLEEFTAFRAVDQRIVTDGEE